MLSEILKKISEINPAMRIALVLSLLFHATIMILATIGFPYIKKEPPKIYTPVPVEILEVAQNNNPKKEKGEEPKSPPKKVEQKPKMPEKVEKVEMKMPPKVEKPTPPKKVEPKIEKEKPKEPAKPKVKPKPKPKTPPLPKKEEKKPEKKPEKKKENKKPQKEENDDEALSSLLRNLQDSENTASPKTEEKPAPAKELSPVERFAQRLTMSEAEALSNQLSRCWSIQAGAKYAEDLVVEIKLFITPDRRVREAVIMNQWRYNAVPAFRAAADSARRAVFSPMCTPLELPPEKYELWKETIVTFDPREML